MKMLFIITVLGLGLNAVASTLVTGVTNARGQNVLADSFSRTLYVFDPDQGSQSSKCVADCAEVWPPYLLSATEASTLAAPLGSVTRANKKLQLTINGRPVYTFASDRTKGDDRGDGLGGVWHVVLP